MAWNDTTEPDCLRLSVSQSFLTAADPQRGPTARIQRSMSLAPKDVIRRNECPMCDSKSDRPENT